MPWHIEPPDENTPTWLIVDGFSGNIICDTDSETNARLFCIAPDLLDFVATLENDDGKIPEWLWDKRTELLARAGHWRAEHAV